MTEPIATSLPETHKTYPASHAQRRLWLLEQMGAQGAYNLSSAYVLEGPLDPSAFRRALYKLAERHQSLRTTFSMVGDQLAQKVHAQPIHQIREPDWRAVAPQDVQAAVDAEAAQSFDLKQACPFRAVLAPLDTDRWLFQFTIHHIVTDGISQNIMVGDLAELYRAAVEDQVPQLPELPLQYKEYAAWQRERLEGPQAEEERHWWREKLAAPLPVIQLPYDHPRPAVKTWAGDWVYRALPNQLVEGLRAKARDVSLFTLLNALCKVLLYRHTHQEDLIVGCAAAGRDRPELEHQVGCFINTLALRDTIKGEMGFHQVLETVRDTVMESFHRQLVPFDQLVAELARDRDPGRSPIFDVMVQLHNQESRDPSLGDVVLKAHLCGFNPAKFDITFDFVEEPSGLRLGLFFNTDLFQKETAERMLGHFQVLTQSILDHWTTPISQLNMLTRTERDRITDWNRTEANWPREENLVSLFARQVAERAAHPAVTYEYVEDKSITLSYKELDHLSGRVAALLTGARGKRVAVMTHRSEQTPAVLLGVLKAGAAYVPIDPEYPEDRIRHILTDSGCHMAVSEQSLTPLLTQIQPDMKVFNLSQLPQNPVDPEPIHPQSPAYVIYTSGSTGKPKGCVVTHGNAVRLFINDRFPFPFNQDDVWVCAHSFCFDYTVWETYGCLLYGAHLIIARPDQMRDISLYHKMLNDYGVTVVGLTPGVFYNLIDFELSREQPGLDAMRCIFLGGDRLEPVHLKPWMARFPLDRIKLINLYGITETTVILTYKYLTENDLRDGGDSPIGGPLPETTAWVCRDGQLMARGVPGELLVGGSGIGAGYLNKPGLTASRFLPDPFADEPGSRLYRTGDLVRRLPDGGLGFIGRCDHQVQVRGFRIEPGEIEARLLEDPQVEKAAVIGRETAGGHVELLAYITGPQADPAAVQARLAQSLPAYMVPARWTRLETMPLSANGKLDRAALPDPDSATMDQSQLPSNDLERVICHLFGELLSVSQVGVDDTFFELGGDSLTASRLTTRLQSWFGCELSMLDVFENPTSGFLAQLLEERNPEKAARIASVLHKMQGMTPAEKQAFLQSKKARNTSTDRTGEA